MHLPKGHRYFCVFILISHMQLIHSLSSNVLSFIFMFPSNKNNPSLLTQVINLCVLPQYHFTIPFIIFIPYYYRTLFLSLNKFSLSTAGYNATLLLSSIVGNLLSATLIFVFLSLPTH